MIAYDDRVRIQKEVVLDAPPARPDSLEEAAYRKRIAKDVKDAADKGQMLDYPTEWD